MKQNCWEYKKCGREPGGATTNEFGVCPAASDTRLDGVHYGKNFGRTCWIIGGTYCKGEIQGTFAKKFRNCMNCDFYQLVQKEEFPGFMLTPLLLKKLGEIK
jgi:hypothetical protein